MKNLIMVIAFAAVGFGGYRFWNEWRPEPTVVVVTPPELPAGPRLAPEGTYFLLDYYGVHTDRGITGWTPGQQVKAVRGKVSEFDKQWVSDGNLQAELDLAFLTRDIDLAARLSSTDTATQAAASKQALAARDQQTTAEKREREQSARADVLTGRTRTRTVYVAAPTPSNPLERAAKPTNGGRQVSSAPDISNVRMYLPPPAPAR